VATALGSKNWERTLQAHRSRAEAVEFLRGQPEPRLAIPKTYQPFTVKHFVAFARHLELDTGGSWKPEPFQRDFLADVFAGVPECWLVVPEGNGKTTLVAGLALYFCEFSPVAVEIPVAASALDQARILYRQAEGFVLRSPALYEPVYSPIQEAKGKLQLTVPRFKVLPALRRIEHYRGSRIQIVAADDRTGDGVIFKLAILDELHRHRGLDLYRTWVGKRHKRGGQIIAISTAGEPGSEFEETRERIRQAAPTIRRERAFVRAASAEVALHEWAVPEKGDVEDLELVKAANPFTGVSLADLQSKRRSPTMTDQHWRRFTCNLPTRGERAAIQEAEWHAAATDERIPEGQPVWLGLDVAWKYDTTAAVPLWIRDREYRLLGPAQVLVPPRDGSMLDPHLVKRMLVELHERNPIHTVVMDMTRAEELAQWMRDELGAEIVERTQSNQHLALDYERFMEALRNGWLHHAGDKALTQHALNAIARLLPNGGARFDRPAPSSGKRTSDQDQRVIDALVAASMAHTTATAGETPQPFFGAWR
jgi:phage terminase large subunit-like protein